MKELSKLTHWVWHRYTLFVSHCPCPWLHVSSLPCFTMSSFFLDATYPRNWQLLQLPSLILPPYMSKGRENKLNWGSGTSQHSFLAPVPPSALWSEHLLGTWISSAWNSLGEEKPELSGPARQGPKRETFKKARQGEVLVMEKIAPGKSSLIQRWIFRNLHFQPRIK